MSLKLHVDKKLPNLATGPQQLVHILLSAAVKSPRYICRIYMYIPQMYWGLFTNVVFHFFSGREGISPLVWYVPFLEFRYFVCSQYVAHVHCFSKTLQVTLHPLFELFLNEGTMFCSHQVCWSNDSY